MRLQLIPSKKRLLRYLKVLCVCVICKLLWTWVMVIDGKSALAGGDRDDLLARRKYLIEQVGNQISPEDMPAQIGSQFQGEWALVTYSMTAMALTNLANRYPETLEESRKVVRGILSEVLKLESRSFDTRRWGRDSLEQLSDLEGHIGYLGHLNLILASCYYLGDPTCQKRFERVSHALAKALERKPFLNAETYPAEIYIPDNAVVIGSLGLFNRAFPKERLSIVDKWIAYAKDHYIDGESGALIFSLEEDGTVGQQSRGSGAAWNVFYLSYADESFARSQYRAIKKSFRLKLFWGLTGIREWREDFWNFGDIDSGPVLLGLSPSGTGFIIAGATIARDQEFLGELLFTSEFVGSSVQLSGKRRYLLSPLVGDAILLAMRTVTSWQLQPPVEGWTRENEIRVDNMRMPNRQK